MAKIDPTSEDAPPSWRHRPPPLGQTPDQYLRCSAIDVASCAHGQFCVRAHSEEELDEWVQRFDPGRFLANLGRGYVQARVDGDKNSWNPLPKYSKLTISPSTAVVTVHKSEQVTWTIKGTANSMPEAIGLLEQNTRPYFKLVKLLNASGVLVAKLDPGEWRAKRGGRIVIAEDPFVGVSFVITVSFSSDVYGEYQQRLGLVFPGQAPLMCRLTACVQAQKTVDFIDELRQKLLSSCKGWSAELKKVPFAPDASLNEATEDELLKRFPPPDAKLAPPEEESLTSESYVSYAGSLLSLEEATRSEMLQRFNVITAINVHDNYTSQDSGRHQAPPGEMFGRIGTRYQLSPDNASGRLILESCQLALLAPLVAGASSKSKSRAYEALIMAKAKHEIVLRLSTEMVKDLSLHAGGQFRSHVRFQPARLPFCEMQEGIRLAAEKSMHLLFPDVTKRPVIPWSPTSHWRPEDDFLNPRQKEAINAMVTKTAQPLPPVLVLGPYGTGKTFTMAHGMKHILTRQPNSRILICTHSNSAADLYILDYLGDWICQGMRVAEPVRIYYRNRWLGTVHPICRAYALFDRKAKPGDPPFRRPTKEDIVKHRVVVATLSITKYLTCLDLPEDTFTHILVDEAAQALEWEMARVLSLAGPNTRLVLAGDHLQMSPDVHNELCQDLGFQRSLLERLQDLYPTDFPCAIMLHDNYRSHAEIVKMTSDLFYGQRLRAKCASSGHPSFPPLSFFCVRGKAKQAIGATGYCNESEVYEVADLVGALLEDWPQKWKDDGQDSICVVAAYAEQVQMIRSELRCRRLSNITVERLQNVQGREFRVVIISTVRTLDSCDGGDNYAFLSDCKLLNTAITRAKSVVAVVGCPVTLCTVGKCARYWEELVQRCAQLDGLFGCTIEDLHSRLGAETLKRLHGLNPLADCFRPVRAKPQLQPVKLQVPQLHVSVEPEPQPVKPQLHVNAEPQLKPQVPQLHVNVEPQSVKPQELGDPESIQDQGELERQPGQAQVKREPEEVVTEPVQPQAHVETQPQPIAHLQLLDHFQPPHQPVQPPPELFPQTRPQLPSIPYHPHPALLLPAGPQHPLFATPPPLLPQQGHPHPAQGRARQRGPPLIPEGPSHAHMVMPYVTPLMPNGLAGAYPVSLVGRPLMLRAPMLSPVPPYVVGMPNGWPGACASISGADPKTVFERLTTSDLLALLPPDVNLSRLLSDTALQTEWRSVLAVRQGAGAVQQFTAIVERFRDMRPVIGACDCSKGTDTTSNSSRSSLSTKPSVPTTSSSSSSSSSSPSSSSSSSTSSVPSRSSTTTPPHSQPAPVIRTEPPEVPVSPVIRTEPPEVSVSPVIITEPPELPVSPTSPSVSCSLSEPVSPAAATVGSSAASVDSEMSPPVAELVVDALLNDEDETWTSDEPSVRGERSVPLYMRGAASASPPPVDTSSYAAAVRRSLEPLSGTMSALPRREDHAHGYSHF